MDYTIRSAQPQDARAIGTLTRHLTETAMGLGNRGQTQQAIGFCLGVGLGLLMAIGLAQPRIILQLGLALSPLLGLLALLSFFYLSQPWVDWADYWVVEQQGEIIACAKLYHNPDSTELYDLCVRSDWRQQGVGTALVQHLIRQTRSPIYLASLPKGFRRIDPRCLSPILQTRLSLMNPRFAHLGLVAMVRDRSKLDSIHQTEAT
jgi:GNAT superfamily N-acetyltransferase